MRPALLALAFLSGFARADRTFIIAPTPWFSAINMTGDWPAGSYFLKNFRLTLKNVSAQPQRVRVTFLFRDGAFVRSATEPLGHQIYVTNSPLLVGGLGAPAVSGDFVKPSASGNVTLTPLGSAGDQALFEWGIQYAGPVPQSFLWMSGNAAFRIEVLEDRGAVTASLSLSGGCAGSCGILSDVNSISSTAPFWLLANGGRPF